MNRQRSERGVRSLSGATVLLALAAGAATAQPVPVRLIDGVRPPTRVLPGDEIVMTVFDPVLFPAAGRWTIAGRSVESGREAGGTYQLAFHAPGDFPQGWEALPIEYVDPHGQLLYDSRSDMRDAVGLADIADPTALVEGRGRLTGASARAPLGGRFCVCGFFPHRRSWEGLALGGTPLGTPLTASSTELWFEIPNDLTAGVHEIAVDPAAGFTEGAWASVEIVTPEAAIDMTGCPCAAGNEFLSNWRESQARPPASTTAPTQPETRPLLWLESLGGSTGDVFRAHVVNPEGGPIEIDGLFAVEPASLSPEERDQALESVRQVAGSHVEVQANFYCLQFGAAAPPEGIVYRIAPQAKQQAFQPAARALAAARRLHDAGSLSPDTSPESYFHSIRQWSVWTLEQGFDRDGFLAAFLEHTRKNVEDAGQEWSDEFADAVRRSAEGRWSDITKVLGEAGLEVAAGG
jgi:hypothetical protein